MRRAKKMKDRKWITRYSKEGERTFFFYATILAAVVSIIVHVLKG